MLQGIPAHLVDEVWDDVRPWIAEACKSSRGKFDENDIRLGLLERDDQLWIWNTPTAFAVCVTRLSNYPKQRVCNLRIVTGRNRDEWYRTGLATIEAWARDNGCAAMELCARPGWSRLLSDYDMTHVYLEKRL
jgi:hypothetical protein